MQVYAVYSDGKEQELSSGEYTVTINETGLLLRKSAQIKVEYEGCSCSFEIKGV